MSVERTLTGPQKAAVLMMTLGEEKCARLFEQMHEEEIREVSAAMSQLGIVSADAVERVCSEFSEGLGSAETLVGDLETTERLLKRALPAGRAVSIMEEIRGPAGRTMWDKLGNISEVVLANYLRNEYPQTVAVVLSRIQAAHAAKVLALLPEEFALDVMTRMLKLENVQKGVLHSVEKTLRSEFVANLPRGSHRNSHEVLADIFNNFDRRLEGRFMEALEAHSHDDAECVRSLMFTFEELVNIPAEGLVTLSNALQREHLIVALKGASDALKTAFFKTMSERSARILRDEIDALGPMRVKDVDAAQNEIMIVAKKLLDRGEIELLDREDIENEMI
ncbi:flagellar motor switch protein G [Neokomagataea thailandica NBRC 106555]|uniref:Flagellar motor switch protein FliG n=3 Tax=Acetobacteraceae TaxID=433 RepID=A0A4Y6V5A7_9PROT|nr:flagellar motor switch protein FliG [Neokomagataea tanensis]GBR51758.1 flagellar motor switch protein G [Neokomagataea thailandica NBRC 106555]